MFKPLSLLLCLFAFSPLLAADDFAEQRQQLIQEIAHKVARDQDLPEGKPLDPAVLSVLGKVPRHRFVPAEQVRQAYRDRPLPIGHGQTISQPTIVALMTDLLRVEPGHKVLEIGTGSGYQAAVLAEVTDQVYSIEIIPPLAEQGAANLRAAGYADVQLRTGDGYYGWPEAAPFDRIMVTAAASHIPPPLLEQLKPGGIMVLPVGSRFAVQQLIRVSKHADGQIITEQLLPVSFVPLTGQR